MPRKKPEQLKEYDYKPLGKQALRRVPVSVKLPAELDDYVRAKSNRNQWLISVIQAAVEAEQQSA